MKCLAVMAVFAVTAGFAPYEVTRAEWQACYDSGGCSYLPPGPDSSSDFPVTGVNHFDVDEYIAWINAKTSKTHRLPTADEWAIASGGLSRRKSKKLFDDPRLAWAADEDGEGGFVLAGDDVGGAIFRVSGSAGRGPFPDIAAKIIDARYCSKAATGL